MSVRVFLAIIAGLSVAWTAQQSRERVYLVDYVGPPRTLAECVSAVEAIAIGRVDTREQRDFGHEIPSPTVVHTVRVERALKWPAGAERSTLEVAQPGGAVIKDGIKHLIDDRGYRVFAPGDRYLFFLKTEKVYGGRFTPAFGPAGALPLSQDGTRVRVPPAAAYLKELAGANDIATTELVGVIQRLLRFHQ